MNRMGTHSLLTRLASTIFGTIAMLSMLAGCQEYHWRIDYQKAEAEAREQGKDLFIFYKYWLDSDSTRMLGHEVLSDPEVKREFARTVNVVIDRDFGPAYQAYVDRFGVKTFPASIIVNPDGTPHTRTGFVPKAQFLEWVKAAKSPPPVSGKSSAAKVGPRENATPTPKREP